MFCSCCFSVSWLSVDAFVSVSVSLSLCLSRPRGSLCPSVSLPLSTRGRVEPTRVIAAEGRQCPPRHRRDEGTEDAGQRTWRRTGSTSCCKASRRGSRRPRRPPTRPGFDQKSRRACPSARRLSQGFFGAISRIAGGASGCCCLRWPSSLPEPEPSSSLSDRSLRFLRRRRTSSFFRRRSPRNPRLWAARRMRLYLGSSRKKRSS